MANMVTMVPCRPTIIAGAMTGSLSFTNTYNLTKGRSGNAGKDPFDSHPRHFAAIEHTRE
ncbi:MAG TPA: hypothetical protein VF458_20160 [Ktedonobacteraceae bacterium]